MRVEYPDKNMAEIIEFFGELIMRLLILFILLFWIAPAQAAFLDDLLSSFKSQANPSRSFNKSQKLPKTMGTKTINKQENNHHNASWYNDRGRRTASGLKAHYGAAHRSLPFGTKLVVTNPANGKSVTATVVDRGPFTAGRDIDINQNVAEFLNFKGIGKLLFEVQ